MITENLTTLKINKLTKAQYEAAAAAGTLNNNELYMTEDPNVDLSDVALKPTITTTTLLASGWNDGAYSFETDYPVENYNLEVALDSTATTEQAEAFNGAQIVGSATSNVVKAYGIVPTVNIPIILKVVNK